ncbi:YDG domain-containing protein [Rubneribacter badeniensis]|uniref:YDG domain-containing protein n=1 Tax=Rubneribacter badeniensis TaxID=2070688 RepID=UPI003A912805
MERRARGQKAASGGMRAVLCVCAIALAAGQVPWTGGFDRAYADEGNGSAAPPSAAALDATAEVRVASTPEELEAAAKDATATSIALGADIDVASLEGGVLKDDYDSYRYKVLFDHSVTLDLNGHELTNSSSNESGKSGTILLFGSLEGKVDAVLMDTAGGENPEGDGLSGRVSGGLPSGIKTVGDDTTLAIKGGVICNNRATQGGGVCVEDGSVVMTGGSIANNVAGGGRSGEGGGVYVGLLSSFTMEGGSITGNTSDQYGGGVAVGVLGKFTMNDGSITGNSVTVAGFQNGGGGGGIANESGTVQFNGGKVTGNSVSGGSTEKPAAGGGVQVDGNKVFIGGPAVIKDNTSFGHSGNDEQPSNMAVSADRPIEVTAGFVSEEPIGITPIGELPGPFVKMGEGVEGSPDRYFKADDPSLQVNPDGTITQAQEVGPLEGEVSLAGSGEVVYGGSITMNVALRNAQTDAPQATVLDQSGETLLSVPLGKEGGSVELSTLAKSIPAGTEQTLTVRVSDGDGRQVEDTVQVTVAPCVIDDAEALTWSDTEGRVENDGGAVTASLASSALVQPSDKVGVEVRGGDVQTAGEHVATAVLTGADAGFYQLGDAIASKTFTIASAPVSLGMTLVASNDRPTYGEAISFTATIEEQERAKLADTSEGIEGSVSFFLGDALLGTASVENGVAAMTYDTAKRTLGLGGSKVEAVYSADEEVRASVSVEVLPRAVDVSGVKALSRVYDGTVDVAVDASSAALSGVLAQDEQAVSFAVDGGRLADADAGTGKAVELKNARIEVSDELEGWYILGSVGALAVDIAPAAVSGVSQAIPATQTVASGAGLSVLVSPELIVGVNGEQVSGTLMWYADAERTQPVDEGYTFKAGGEPVTLWWSFVPASSNYATAEGSVDVTVEATEPGPVDPDPGEDPTPGDPDPAPDPNDPDSGLTPLPMPDAPKGSAGGSNALASTGDAAAVAPLVAIATTAGALALATALRGMRRTQGNRR